MNEENCIVCLDKYDGTKEEHLENCRRFPVITDISPKDREISRLYLMDIDYIEYAYCDCIRYDRNGNLNCGLHQGRLQEFYAKPKVFSRSLIGPKTKITYHLSKDGIPYCNARTIDEQKWLETEEYITCKNCLRSELTSRKREIKEAQKNFKWKEDKHFFKMDRFKAVGQVKDLK